MTTLILSTRNRHKLQECQEILGTEFLVQGLDSLPQVPPVEENGTTFAENAALKALAASVHTAHWVLADDSGLVVDALGGAPGVFSARYAGAEAMDSDNNALLLHNLQEIRGQKRSARFRCVLALARGGEVIGHYSGSVEGYILPAPKGECGFGYDPLFVPVGYCESFAQLGPEVKHQLSHRARALAALREAWPALNSQ
jgi:XTP/dITP diphosphohydrolase